MPRFSRAELERHVAGNGPIRRVEVVDVAGEVIEVNDALANRQAVLNRLAEERVLAHAVEGLVRGGHALRRKRAARCD